MATQKEMEALTQVIDAAIKVNASSARVNVNVEIDNAQVSVRISDPIVVLANCHDSNWDWLFYSDESAYFTDDVFTEDAFIVRCQEFIDAINGFYGRTVSGGSQ